ncbi:heavy metal translocating P-type ATPase [Deinococcus deserti]|uniref:Putative Lead, cadmium, zinc and mercury-transporting ATPase n=1 Tax=Deinococcus deserti (strain DSM 17065 / CIP 109153 / LMG 22923 / VCD115) TaxID=546414 RepID=C1CZ27_DEIDV|nr:heavy metal translocating P-type ATPase [Deinococcus deserti]ACO45065.1 putative Lead, cadmium, zinc and mercury-transporting ATPase [Deinococcus deserti VCD115]
MTSRTAPDSTELSYIVEGMDCASCVQKVERMVGRLPGTAEVRTSFSRQSLQLQLDESQTPRDLLETNLRALGYRPSVLTPAEDAQLATDSDQGQHAHALEQGAGQQAAGAGPAWYATGQGRVVVTAGTLLLLAWAGSFVAPAWSVPGYIAATLLGTWPLLRRAVASARLGEPFSIYTLVSLAALGAIGIGEAAEGAVVVFLFAVGELLEGLAAGRARAGIRSLAALAPRTAQLVTAEGLREVPAERLRPGQTVQVNPGARVPADGTILSGRSSLDDSPVTGESVPVDKEAGDHVYAGSINTNGTLTVRVDREAADNTIARIIHMVQEAEGSRSPTARFIDRFSRVYTPGVVLVSALVAVVPPLLGQAWEPWLYRGISLLLIGCPCALVLSVPAAITSGISAGARRGLLIKGGAALEAIGQVRTIAFDKTGTLTVGRPRVTEVQGHGLSELEVLRLAAAVESGSSHPLARAIVEEAGSRGLSLPAAANSQTMPGLGVGATVEGRLITVASPRFAAQHAELPVSLAQAVARYETQGRTAVLILDNAAPVGVIGLRDEPRADARPAIAALRRLGVHPVMLTGDNARAAQAIAADLGLEVHAALLPADKLRLIGELPGPVAMVGDGINDAPALARADVGIAMSGGTDVALETAGAALLHDRVGGVADLVSLSRATLHNIRQNIAFALGLKAIFLVTTLLGFTSLWMAVLADTGATALVTANALRLLRWKGGSK